jgi:hypothetical protein
VNFLLQFIFVACFLLLLVVSIIILRPFRIHKRRPISTVIFKLSYLVYLLVFLILAYLVLFYSRNQEEIEEPGKKNPFTIYYVMVIIAFLVPNLGIMFRRKVIKLRVQYNVIFTGINLAVILILSFIIYTIPWEF